MVPIAPNKERTMGNDIIYHLPAYPSTQARKSLSPSQLANINQTISSSLSHTIALPPDKRDSPATHRFIASYAKDAALQVLQGLIWTPEALSKEDKLIRSRTLTLAEKIAAQAGLDIQTLLDLAIACASTSLSRVKLVLTSAVYSDSDNSLVRAVETDLVPAFTQLFDPAQGLYGIRKAAHCISSFLHASPPEIVRCFAHSKPFVLALGTLYDTGLASIANSYGGLTVLRNRSEGASGSNGVDEWESIWVQTKVDLIDAFHVVVSTLLNDISSASGRSLAAESERTFDLIFGLLELPNTSTSSSTTAPVVPTPYLNRPLLTDYQQSYSLSSILATALRNAAEKDARLDLLESTLQSLESADKNNPGVLKLLISSSGVAPGTDNRGNGGRVRSTEAGGSTVHQAPAQSSGKGKGKEIATRPSVSHVPDIELKITQVLDILPDHPPAYVRALLEHPPYDGDPEKVVGALLEGTAPSPEELEPPADTGHSYESQVDDVRQFVDNRRNAFDGQEMDVSQLRIGKQRQDEATVLRDRTFIEQMKADILRRAEAISDDENEDEEYEDPEAYGTGSTNTKRKGVVVAFDEEDDGAGGVKIGGDGEESEGDDDEENKDDAPPKAQSTETILELAYIRDPKLFDRDATTRRSKARADLKAQTRWDDEQIEGWRIMLERNPRKDKILQKHEFSGNQNQIPVAGGSGGS
ncbi:hypothetical protein H0H81_002266, partial [Sphagnurus paluster]